MEILENMQLISGLSNVIKNYKNKSYISIPIIHTKSTTAI